VKVSDSAPDATRETAIGTATKGRPITVALIGNPNTGKSTLFSALSGTRQRVGNYPGVTVEKKVGRASFEGQSFEIIDLPGTYSLAPRSPDEMVAVDVLLGRQADTLRPDVVLCIVDASNLERNLYLLSQVLELGLPTVVALNMVDVAQDKGLTIDLTLLKKRLPTAVVEVQANRGKGIQTLKAALAEAVDHVRPTDISPFPALFQQEVEQLRTLATSDGESPLPRYLIERLLLDTSGHLAAAGLPGVDDSLQASVVEARKRLAKAGLPVPAVEAMSRYAWVGEVLKGVVKRPDRSRVTLSDRIDRVLTHRVFGTLVFIAVMFLLFQAVFYVAGPAGDAIDWLNGELGSLVDARLADGAIKSLLINGVIAGVGGVLVFLPQIFTLFFFLAILEDCGYMARAAYLMDKLMSRVGLSGKSFIPLLSSFACAIPGIMATRVIENRRDRLVTMLVAPLMTCSARLPVYVLLIAAFIPDIKYVGGMIRLQSLVMLGLYLLGIVTAIAVAGILKLTLLRGETPPFVMELPSYKTPGPWIVLQRMLEQGWAFVYRAGTLILAVSIVIWALAYYPHDANSVDSKLVARQAELSAEMAKLDAEQVAEGAKKQLADELSHVNNLIAGDHLANSYLGRMGRFIEPAVRPLGWDWKIGCAAIASFPAREVVVATLGVIYNLGEDVDENSGQLQETLQDAKWHGTDRPVFTIPVALSVMVFFALCAQCVSTLAIMYRESGGWRWPIFTFVYMTTLAYVGSFITYQVGSWLMG
jgi:ferrous iron transport protein B